MTSRWWWCLDIIGSVSGGLPEICSLGEWEQKANDRHQVETFPREPSRKGKTMFIMHAANIAHYPGPNVILQVGNHNVSEEIQTQWGGGTCSRSSVGCCFWEPHIQEGHSASLKPARFEGPHIPWPGRATTFSAWITCSFPGWLWDVVKRRLFIQWILTEHCMSGT